MADFQKNKLLHSFLYSKPALTVLILILILLAYSVIDIYGKTRETVQKRNFAEEKVKELEDREGKLTEQIKSLKTESGVEASLRDKFGLVKEGEGIVVIVDDKKNVDQGFSKSRSGFVMFFKNLFK